MVGHENLWGSIKMLNFMGAMLRDSYGIPAVEDEQYEETKAFYEHYRRLAWSRILPENTNGVIVPLCPLKQMSGKS